MRRYATSETEAEWCAWQRAAYNGDETAAARITAVKGCRGAWIGGASATGLRGTGAIPARDLVVFDVDGNVGDADEVLHVGPPDRRAPVEREMLSVGLSEEAR